MEMNWFKKLLPSRIRIDGANKKSIPEGVWTSCPECNAVLYKAELERNLDVCMKCGHHLRIGARQRIRYLLDEDSIEYIGMSLAPVDFLKFKDSKRYGQVRPPPLPRQCTARWLTSAGAFFAGACFFLG